jgi:hypothetical protein
METEDRRGDVRRAPRPDVGSREELDPTYRRLSALPPAPHPGNDDRPARAILRGEPRCALAHGARAGKVVFVRHRIGRGIEPVGIGRNDPNSCSRARAARLRESVGGHGIPIRRCTYALRTRRIHGRKTERGRAEREHDERARSCRFKAHDRSHARRSRSWRQRPMLTCARRYLDRYLGRRPALP